jgi:hypothetical protein
MCFLVRRKEVFLDGEEEHLSQPNRNQDLYTECEDVQVSRKTEMSKREVYERQDYRVNQILTLSREVIGSSSNGPSYATGW